ncbi:MAG TPA: hypothetical protein ENN91_00810 [Firmicutes bacterium]|nr:hypothetical protein [Bacillota bacterium]
MSLERQRLLWVIVFLVVVLSAFIVPFTPIMTNLAKFYGAFLFWSIFALVVIAFLGIITARWKDDRDER